MATRRRRGVCAQPGDRERRLDLPTDAPVRFLRLGGETGCSSPATMGFCMRWPAGRAPAFEAGRAGSPRRAGQQRLIPPLACSSDRFGRRRGCTSSRASGQRGLLVRPGRQSAEVGGATMTPAPDLPQPTAGANVSRRLGARYLPSRATCCWSTGPRRAPRSSADGETEVLHLQRYATTQCRVTADGPLMFHTDSL